MKIYYSKAAIFLSFVLVTVSAEAVQCRRWMEDGDLPFEVKSQITVAVEAQRQKDNIPGMTYAVANDSTLLTSGASGKFTQEAQGRREVKLRADKTLIRMASVSKLFTTLAASKLIEARLLDPEAEIISYSNAKFVKYLLQNETPERLEMWKKIKVKHLMSHQTGFSKDSPGTLVFFNKESLKDHSYPTEAAVLEGLTSVEFIFNPEQIPSGMKYSNLGMNLLALLVEAQNPKRLSFEAYVRKAILDPLKMNDTFYDIPYSRLEDLAQGYTAPYNQGSRTPVPKAYRVGEYSGSIGVATTAEDLARFGQALLQISLGKSDLLRNPQVITDWFKLTSRGSPALAWARGPLWQTMPGETADQAIWFGHTGTGPSERTILSISPEKNMVVVVISTTMDAPRETYVKMISDLIPAQPSVLTPLAEQLVNQSREFFKGYTTASALYS